MEKAERHIPVLDGIRGLAILLVLVHHMVLGGVPFSGSFLGQAARGLTESCWVGVDLFFVLSGFLITGILYDTKGSGNYFRVFYARRFLRIFPLYYGFLFLVMALTGPLQITWGGRQFIYLAYLQNTGIARHIFSQPLSPFITITQLWSLAVEEQFYFVWPALVFLLKDRIKIMRIAALLTAGSIGLRIWMVWMHSPFGTIYTFTPTRADSLMIGSLLALALRSSPETQKMLIRAAWFVLPGSIAVLIGLAWPYGRLNWESSGVAVFGYTVIALASAALITLSLETPVFKAALNRPILRMLGKYSYGIYILHAPIIMLAVRLDLAGRLERIANAGVGLHLPVFVMACLTSIAIAALSFHFYESRFLRLKRYFRYDFPDPSASAGAAPAEPQQSAMPAPELLSPRVP
jgi:peptidoglycan/LPS O-acetylase OafA/YrhL